MSSASNIENDDTDARRTSSNNSSSSHSTNKVPHAERLGFTDSEEYCTSFLKRGLAIVVSNKYFEPETGLSIRVGTDLDASRLEQTLLDLGFTVKLYHNLMAKELVSVLDDVALNDHSNADCFLFVLLSHGDDKDLVYGCDRAISIDYLTQPFKRSSNTLSGKPKIFIFQACRGQRLMESVYKQSFNTDDDTISYVPQIPIEADFLMVYSTVPGYYSWRNSMKGSWFIQALCDVLREHGKEWDLLRIFTKVNRRVAYDYESSCTDQIMSNRKQIPCIVSTLTKDFYFKSK